MAPGQPTPPGGHVRCVNSYVSETKGRAMLNCVSKALRATCAAALAVALVPAVPASAWADALPDAVRTGTVQAGTWTLEYSVSEGEATITGYTAPASAANLVIPESVEGGVPVTTIADSAFMDCDRLGEVVIADTVTRVSSNAFRNTSATSITLGTGAICVGNYTFAYNTALTTFTFKEGCHPEYLGHHAFAYSTALVELTIPALLGDAHKNEWNLTNTTGMGASPTANRLGDGCFYGCTGMRRITYLPGAANGGADYLSNNNLGTGYSIYGTSVSNLEIVSYLTNSGVTGTGMNYNTAGATMYYAVYFYGSEEAAAADTTLTQAEATVVLRGGTYYSGIVQGNVANDWYLEGSDKIPPVSDFTDEPDMLWGFSLANTTSDSRSYTVDTYLTGVKQAYPVSRNDMNYVRLESPETTNYMNAGNGVLSAFRGNDSYIRIDGHGGVALDHIKAYYLDGREVDPSLYTMHYYQFETSEGIAGTTQLTNEVTAGQMVSGSSYYAFARGVGAYAETSSKGLQFYVRRYDATLVDCTSGTVAETSGKAINSVVSQLTSPAYMVMAPASDWRTSLVATAYAAVGRGLCVYSDGTENGDDAYYALLNAISKTDTVTFVGDPDALGADAIARAKLLTESKGGTYNYFTQADANELALTIYDTVAKYGPRADEPYCWGDAAVVVPWGDALTAPAASQLACALNAPVFFAAADGSVSSAVTGRLAAFSRVYAIGADAKISAAGLSALEATGCQVVSVNTGDTALSASLACLEALGQELGKVLVVGAGSEPTAVMAAAQYAQVQGGVMLSCASVAEAKQLQDWLSERNYDELSTLCLVGDFSVADASIADRLLSVYETPWGTQVTTGDTFAAGGLLYQIKTGGTAAVASVLPGVTQVSLPTSVTLGTTTYKVASVAATAFKGNTTLTSVNLGSSLTTLPSSALSGCTALTTVTGGAALTALPSSVFSGCTRLSTVSLSSKVLKKVGTAAFKGCTALTTLKLSSPALTSLGSQALSGCTALKSVTISSKKLATIGASAFAGCTRLTSFTNSSSALKTIGKQAFSGCTALKAFKVTSKVLKKIGAAAFKGCKKLKTLKLTGTTKLTKAGVKQSLKGSSVKTVRVPKAKVKKYTKFFSKANCKAKVTVKKK